MTLEFDLRLFEPPKEIKDLYWCTWEWRWDYDKQKWKKPPHSPSGEELRVNNLKGWGRYSEVAPYKRRGYLLSKSSGICVIDLDGCRNPQTGEIDDWAWEIIQALFSYTEISPSGTGVHIIIFGEKPENSRSRFHLDGHEVEVYDSNRYITFTGDVVDFYFVVRSGQDWIEENVPTDTVVPRDLALEIPELELTDNQIIQKLSSFSYGEKFKNLYRGNWEDNYESQSEADLAFCFYLAFMTKDEKQIDRIFRTSGLYREKWDRDEYRTWTINKALESNQGFYVPSVSKQMVEELFCLRLRIRWKRYSLAYVYGALLTMAHRHSGVSDEGVLVFASSRDIKLLSGLNVSGKNLSSLIRELQDLGLIQILEKGFEGVATSYLIYPESHILNNLSTLLIDPTIFPPITPHLCLMMWVQSESKLQYQRGLNATQKAVIELSQLHHFPVEELASMMGMRKNNFKSRILKGLKSYVSIDAKGFITPHQSIEKVLDQNFDKERYHTLREEIVKERKEYKNKILFEPIRRYLDTTKTHNQNV